VTPDRYLRGLDRALDLLALHRPGSFHDDGEVPPRVATTCVLVAAHVHENERLFAAIGGEPLVTEP
jgi:hypothetical protein